MERSRAIELLKIAVPQDESLDEDGLFLEAVSMAIEALKQPKIIRCAECKWFQCNMRMDGYLPKGVDEFECRHWCGPCDPVDFCSHAERIKTNGQN